MREILNVIGKKSNLFFSTIHGLDHWKQVENNGLYLAQFTGADPKVVSLFAYFHDSMRENEGDDPTHGIRGAQLAKSMRNKLDLSDTQFKFLFSACSGHTYGERTNNVTIATCWDADRLDLGRVGVIPHSDYLFSVEAKRIADECDYNVLINKK